MSLMTFINIHKKKNNNQISFVYTKEKKLQKNDTGRTLLFFCLIRLRFKNKGNKKSLLFFILSQSYNHIRTN